MESLLGLALSAVIVYAVIRLARRRQSGGSRRFKCHDCRHLRRSFDDGVMCGYGTSEVFKTRAHISMCPDWSPHVRR